MIKKTAVLITAAACLFFSVSCADRKPAQGIKSIKGKRVFYLDSYHKGYEPNIPSRKIIDASLSAKGVLKTEFYLNTKFEHLPELVRKNSAAAAEQIRIFSPDLIIAADDPALDHVIYPYFCSSEIPVVFTGANWELSAGISSCKNITGQIEVEFIKELVDFLKPYSKSQKLFFLQGNTDTDIKSIGYYERKLKITPNKNVFVDDFHTWKKVYLSFQAEPGIVILRNNSGIEGWDEREAREFILRNTKNPSGTVSSHMWRYCLVSFAKDNYEFGEYASKTAVELLRGEKISGLNFEKNMRVSKILNMKLASKLGIIFPADVIEESEFSEEQDD